MTQQASTQQPAATPSISQVTPQTIPAGSQSTTLKVTGTNFPAKAAILWNGAAVATTVIDANNLSGTIGSNNLSTPATVQLQVQNTQTMQASQAVPVVITPPSGGGSSTSLAIATSSLPQGGVSAPYAVTLTATGGTSPYTWSVTSGQLPAGLNLAANTGILSGTPTASGNYSFGVTATDASSPAQSATATLALTIGAAPSTPNALIINTSSLPSGTIGSAYTTLLQASGGTAPYNWSFVSGNLSAGLSLNTSTGLISGAPTATGTATFTAAVADSASPALTKSVTLSIVVAPISLAITTSSLPSGTIGTGYSTLLQAGGGTAPYTWSISAGSLPAGLSLSTATGIISGAPTASGTASFTATVIDAGSPAQTKSVVLSLTIAPSTLTISSSSLPAGTQSSGYSSVLQAGGGTAPYTWSITSGALPAGLTLDAGGLVHGTPTVSSSSTPFSFGVTVKDAGSPAQSASATVTLAIVAAGTPLAISSTSLPTGTPNQPYSATLNATGGTAPYTWGMSGTPAAGLTFKNGVLSGTPTASGSSSLTFTVTDSSSPAPQTKSATLSLVVAAPTLTLTTSSVPSGTKGSSYSTLLQASGGTTPYAWTVTSGSLPAGLSLASSTGLISGTPTATGTSTFTVTLTDGGSPAQTQTVNLSLVIAAPAPPALTIATSSLPSGTKGTSYSNALQGGGGTTPYAWSVTAGSLPAGLSIVSSTGLISGTPTATGTSNFTVTLTDGGSPAQTKSVALSIVVAAPAPPALTISTSSMPSGTKGASYSNTLQASGGTTPYAWSVTTGSLPAGLSLASATGLISGTPTATGTTSFTATVTDAGSPAQTKSVNLSIVVAATSPSLTISATLPAGTVGTGYSSPMTATGGTPAYTWSITAGSLPAGLTLAATSGTISGTPTATGTSTFTATVTDNSNPALTQSAPTSIVVAAATTSGPGTVWHIRHDGGDNIQCKGTTNAAYPGSGTGMACAYNHPFQMMNWLGGWASFTSGDTMEFDDPPTNTTPYYIGEQNGGVGMDWKSTIGAICPAPNSPRSQGASCILPILPSGVTIKGQNFGSCHTANHTGLVNPTILSGINGIFAVFQVQGTSNVNISCIEVTQPDTCTSAGTGHGPGQCGDTSNFVNYAGLMLSYQTIQGPANMTLTDFAVVGTSNRGIMGSHLNLLSTDTFTASDIYLIGNGQAGWDGDGGGCGTSCESVGTMNISYADIEWNGCMAVKPYNIGITPEANPNGFNYCYGQSTSGYGDGFVQIAAGDLTLNMTHSVFKYNTQDGFDGAHLSDDPATSPKTTISYSWSEGNAGQTFKIGAGASSAGINNVSISNCHILSQSSAFPNNPSGWITLDGGDTCRAAGDQWSLTLRSNTSITLENNTSVGYGTTMYDFECSLTDTSCGSNGATIIFTNNISKGYPDPANAAVLASGIYLGAGLTSANVTASFNLWNTMHTGCPSNVLPGETHYVCADPLLAGELNIDAINPSLTSSSPAIGAGVSISGITTDYNGVTRPNPPSIGAQEPPH